MNNEPSPIDDIRALINMIGLRTTFAFIPWGLSPKKHHRTPSLNWRVTLWVHDYKILEMDYSCGSMRCPAYSDEMLGALDSPQRRAAILAECESGRSRHGARGVEQITPDPIDVIYFIASDYGAMLDFADFEAWAADYGYKTDSREALSIYRLRLANAVRLNAALGSGCVAQLREAYEEY